ncbi:hypothetical protein PPRY_b0925 [Pseudoalteromonas prydzensis ACAM 620]|nr:hypothetical protein [Pseudoalteromonas prydzensis ACAM 620]
MPLLATSNLTYATIKTQPFIFYSFKPFQSLYATKLKTPHNKRE